eukprot:m51a1_g11744 hypothetical protein (787) ;mRNA; f:156691-159112
MADQPQRRRQFRKKTRDTSDDPAADPVPAPAAPAPAAASPAAAVSPPSPRPAPSSRPVAALSFNDDSDDAQDLRPAHKASLRASVAAQHPVARAQRKKPPQASSSSSSSYRSSAMTSASGEYTSEMLAALRKNAQALPVSSAAQPAAIVIADDDDGDGDGAAKPQASESSPMQVVEPVDVIDVEDEGDGGGGEGAGEGVVSRAEIAAAKARRAAAAGSTGSADDFVPLDSSKPVGRAPAKESRLVDEDQEEDEDADGDNYEVFEENRGSRIRFAVPDAGRQRKPSAASTDVVVSGVGDEEDEATRRWVDEQMSKGTKSAALRSTTATGEPASGRHRSRASSATFGALSLRRVEAVLPESVRSRIAESLAAVRAKQSSERAALGRVRSDREACEAAARQQDEQAAAAREQRAFFREMLEFAENLVDLYAERAPAIERLEADLMAAEKELAGSYTRRSDARLAGAAEAREESIDDSDGDDGQGDRELSVARDRVLLEAETVLADVEDEFRSPVRIKERFERWKWGYAASYRQAYCAMTMPALFAPLVRHELLAWDPLSGEPFDSQGWFLALCTYGVRDNASGGADEEEDDPDNRLVPALVERVVFPRAQNALLCRWDPFSSRSTSAALRLVAELVPYVGSADSLSGVLGAVLAVLQGAAARVSQPQRTPAAERARVWRAVRLFRSAARWHRHLSPLSLQKVALETVLNMALLPALRAMDPARAADVAREVVGPRCPARCPTPPATLFGDWLAALPGALAHSTGDAVAAAELARACARMQERIGFAKKP